MDIQSYIASGIVEDYCLGVLDKEQSAQVEQLAVKYPDLKNEIIACRKALENYAADVAVPPLPALKNKILDALDNLSVEYKRSADNLPFLNKHTEHTNWLQIVKPLLPATLDEEIFVKVLRDDEKVFQTVIWTKTDYPDEVHDDLLECFIVLEGECECYIGDDVIRLGPGGFVDIPLYTHHDVKVVKGPVLAIVQRLKVA